MVPTKTIIPSRQKYKEVLFGLFKFSIYFVCISSFLVQLLLQIMEFTKERTTMSSMFTTQEKSMMPVTTICPGKAYKTLTGLPYTEDLYKNNTFGLNEIIDRDVWLTPGNWTYYVRIVLKYRVLSTSQLLQNSLAV
jgi:hypothetical protein